MPGDAAMTDGAVAGAGDGPAVCSSRPRGEPSPVAAAGGVTPPQVDLAETLILPTPGARPKTQPAGQAQPEPGPSAAATSGDARSAAERGVIPRATGGRAGRAPIGSAVGRAVPVRGTCRRTGAEPVRPADQCRCRQWLGRSCRGRRRARSASPAATARHGHRYRQPRLRPPGATSPPAGLGLSRPAEHLRRPGQSAGAHRRARLRGIEVEAVEVNSDQPRARPTATSTCSAAARTCRRSWPRTGCAPTAGLAAAATSAARWSSLSAPATSCWATGSAASRASRSRAWPSWTSAAAAASGAVSASWSRTSTRRSACPGSPASRTIRA